MGLPALGPGYTEPMFYTSTYVLPLLLDSQSPEGKETATKNKNFWYSKKFYFWLALDSIV